MKKKAYGKVSYSAIMSEIGIDLIITIGLIFLFFPVVKDALIGQKIYQSQIVKISTKLPDTIPKEEKITALSVTDIWRYRNNNQLSAYGSISIPSLKWQQPIFVGMTNENLFYGGVAMYPRRTLNQGNFVVFGHHLGMQELLFGSILEAKKGQKVIVSFLEQSQVYRIVDIRVIDETDLSVVSQTDNNQLTIFTCPTPQVTSQRYVIVAKPEKESEQKLQTQVAKINQEISQKATVDSQKIRQTFYYLIGLIVLSILIIRIFFAKVVY